MPSNKKTPEKTVVSIKMLRRNGYTYKEIVERLNVSKSVVQKYAHDVEMLPPELRVDPYEKLTDLGKMKLPVRDDYKSKKRMKEYWLENHIEGERFEGPLELYSLDELIGMMKEPTDYQSPLNMDDWYNHYIAPMMFKGVSTTLSKTQQEINKFLDEHQHALVEVFRKAGKTVLVVGRLVNNIVENREENFAVQSEIIDRSRDRVMAVRAHLQSNPKLIADYGYLPHDKKYRNTTALWKSGEFIIKRETIQTDPTLKALSWKDSKLLGGHFKGVLFDDPWSIKLEENRDSNKAKWFRWYDSTLVGSMESDSFQHIICTRKGLYDIYRELEDRGIFVVYKKAAIINYPTDIEYIKKGGKIKDVRYSDDGQISDPSNGRFDMRFFLMQKVQMASEAWEMEYMLNPVPQKGRMLRWDDVQFYKMSDLCQLNPNKIDINIRVIGAMDLAFGTSSTAHYTALVIMGAKGNDLYLIQAYLRRGASKMNKARMIDIAKEDYPSLRKVYIESDLQQSAYVRELQELVSSVRIEPVLSRHEEGVLKKGDIGKLTPKAVRIYSQLDEVVESQRFYVRKDMRHFDEWEREFKEFPRSKFDDLIDAVGLATSKLKKRRGKVWGFSG
jgi:phage terminase large subunit-like protein/transcriptional regulator with XRE-family HTH domain